MFEAIQERPPETASHEDVHVRKITASKFSFSDVLEQLKSIVGSEHVLAGADALALYARSTLPQQTRPSAIVRPTNTKEIQRVVNIANQYQLKLHTLSSGKNWGYGDACASIEGQLILDLRRMNRIVEVNAELAYAVIEPGVTQGQLRDYIDANKIPLWTDATGAGPSASIVGNTLERGFGHTPHGDRFAHVCGLEIVLADGTLLKTGLGHFENSQVANVYKWGVGPYLDGIFTQSNLGVVTRMTVWLLPKPECFKAFIFSVKNEAGLGSVIDALRPLRLRGTLQTPVHIGNDLRMMAMQQAYPWEEMHGVTPLDSKIRDQMRKKSGVGMWTATGGLYGSSAEVAAAEKEIRKALRKIPELKFSYFIDQRKLSWIKRLSRLAARLGVCSGLQKRVGKLEALFDLLQGISPANSVQGGLWRARKAGVDAAQRSADPLDHRAGFIWISPIVPMTREHVERLNQLLEPLYNRYGFDYQVTFSMVSARALCAVTTISYDKDSAEESQRALNCHDEALEVLLKAGYVPYRAGWLTMNSLWKHSSEFFDVSSKIKTALDPNSIFSPGHYIPDQP